LAAAGPRQGSRSLDDSNDVDDGEFIDDVKAVVDVEQVDADDGEFIRDVKAVVGAELIGDTKGVVDVEQVDVNDCEFAVDVKAVVVGERFEFDGGELIGGTEGIVVCKPVDVAELIDDDKGVVGASEHADMVKSDKALVPVGDDGCEDVDIVKHSIALEHDGDANVDEPLSSDDFKRLNEGDSISISSFSFSSVDVAGCIIDSLLSFLLVFLKYFVNTLFIFDI
jgi:hypothetical protein